MQKYITPMYLVHIPKTGGGSFKHICSRLFKDKFCGKNLHKINPNDFLIIQDHRAHTEFKNIALGTFLRDPIERTISHYFWWKEHDNFRLRKTPKKLFNMPHHLTLEEFAKEIPNYMTTYVGPILNKYQFIGIQERYKESIELFKQGMGITTDIEIPRLNSAKTKTEVSEVQRKKLKKYLIEDYKLYNRALKIFNHRIKELER